MTDIWKTLTRTRSRHVLSLTGDANDFDKKTVSSKRLCFHFVESSDAAWHACLFIVPLSHSSSFLTSYFLLLISHPISYHNLISPFVSWTLGRISIVIKYNTITHLCLLKHYFILFLYQFSHKLLYSYCYHKLKYTSDGWWKSVPVQSFEINSWISIDSLSVKNSKLLCGSTFKSTYVRILYLGWNSAFFILGGIPPVHAFKLFFHMKMMMMVFKYYIIFLLNSSSPVANSF